MYGENPFIWLILTVLDLYMWIVIAAVALSWLVNFGVINPYNSFARGVMRTLDGLTEPVFSQVRKVVPAVGGLDFSPLIVIIGLQFLEKLVLWY